MARRVLSIPPPQGCAPPTVPFHTCVDCALHPCALWVCGPYVWPPAVCTPHSAWLAPSLPSPPRCKLRSHCHWDLKYLHPRRKSTHLVPLGTHEQVEPGVDPPRHMGCPGDHPTSRSWACPSESPRQSQGWPAATPAPTVSSWG